MPILKRINVSNMARKCKQKQLKDAIALVVDGQDEKWYIDKVKDHYPCDALKSIRVKPELPVRKKVQELFDFAENKLNEGYSYVVLIFDMDEPLKDIKELNTFKELYAKYTAVRNNNLTGRQKSKYGWMNNLLLIVNNPCLEYWYLLHYRKATKFFADFAALLPELRKIKELAKYEKCENYYNNHPNIYERLGKNNGLNNARMNAIPFNISNCSTQGCSEMNNLFDYFDGL